MSQIFIVFIKLFIDKPQQVFSVDSEEKIMVEKRKKSLCISTKTDVFSKVNNSNGEQNRHV